jgi:CHAT domain-containing protein/tetratricopeptide (TPR) repeat protein
MSPLHSCLLPIVLGAWTLGCRDPRPPPDRDVGGSSTVALPTTLDSLVAAADSFYRAGEYARAREGWSAALARLRAGRDLATEARILTSLGLTEWRLGNPQTARSRVEQARSLLEEAGGPRSLLPRTYNALGLIAWDQGRLTEAAELWRRTMEIAREVGDQEYVDKPAMNLGLYYSAIGEFGNARQAFRESRLAGRRLGIPALELRSLVNLAMVANRTGEPREALRWLDSAVAANLQQDFLAEDMYRSQLAVAAWALGDPGVALVALDSAIRRARTAGLRESEAANLALKADIYWEAGDGVRALDLYTQAAAIHHRLDLPGEQGQDLRSAAQIRAALGHPDEARGLAFQALKLHQQAGELVDQLDDHLLLAEFGEADHLAPARHIAAQLGTRSARTRLGLVEGRLAEREGHPRAVLRLLVAISRDLAIGLSAETSEAEALRARAYASLGVWDSAAAAGRRAVAALERTRRGYGSSLLGASFASFRARIYGDVVAALLALGRIDEAFDVADAAREGWVQRLAGSLPGPAASVRRSGDREAMLQEIAALEDQIREMEPEGRDTRELEERLHRAERDYEIGLLDIDAAAPPVARNHTRADQVREGLAPDQAMLAYLVTPERLFVFTLTRDQAGAVTVPVPGSEIEARVRLARAMLADPHVPPEDAAAVLRVLCRWLLPPGDSALTGVRRLLIVPHGVLAYLPFSALMMPDGRYLVERYSLAHLPSASFAARGETRAAPQVSTPVQLTALAPEPGQLPATALEVCAIGHTHRGSRILLGPHASESALRSALRSGAVVHVASHGVLNHVNPLFSRIELVPGRSRSPDDDGRLEVHEVLGLEIQSPLVFLSGCETGLGPGGSRRYTPGEDYATLAAAFLTAGAKHVVATFWAIPDTGAAAFATWFYAELGRIGPAEALAAAQRALLADRRFRHPYYWAGYRVAGSESSGGPAAVP